MVPRPGSDFEPDASTVALDDFLDDGEPDAVALVLPALVQPPEHLKDAVSILLVDTDAVVLNPELALAIALFGADTDQRLAVAMKFDRVADDVLKHLTELRLVGANRGEFAPHNLGAALVDGGFERQDRIFHDQRALDLDRHLGVRADSGIFE